MMNLNYFCGIDVSKDSFSVAVKSPYSSTKEKSFQMNKNGFNDFENFISNFKSQLLVGMESTGIYHKNLFHFLSTKGYHTVEIDPYKMWKFFRFTNSKPSTSDKKSAKSIADFLEFSKNNLLPSPPLNKNKYSLRYFVREKENISQNIAKTKTEIKRILYLLFPEIVKSSSVFTKNIFSLLLLFPSAYKIKSLSFDEFSSRISSIYKKHSNFHLKIYNLASSYIAGNFPVYEQLLKIKISRLFYLFQEKQNISNLINQIADEFFKREIEILTSIPGIGRESAIYFLAEIIDINRFPNKRNLIGFCGLDPVVKQSGNYKASFRISKRGNSHARRIAWIMANSVSKYCPYFKNYFLKKSQIQQKSYKEAIVATSTKLLATIYVLLRENRTFIP